MPTESKCKCVEQDVTNKKSKRVHGQSMYPFFHRLLCSYWVAASVLSKYFPEYDMSSGKRPHPPKDTLIHSHSFSSFLIKSELFLVILPSCPYLFLSRFLFLFLIFSEHWAATSDFWEIQRNYESFSFFSLFLILSSYNSVTTKSRE